MPAASGAGGRASAPRDRPPRVPGRPTSTRCVTGRARLAGVDAGVPLVVPEREHLRHVRHGIAPARDRRSSRSIVGRDPGARRRPRWSRARLAAPLRLARPVGQDRLVARGRCALVPCHGGRSGSCRGCAVRPRRRPRIRVPSASRGPGAFPRAACGRAAGTAPDAPGGPARRGWAPAPWPADPVAQRELALGERAADGRRWCSSPPVERGRPGNRVRRPHWPSTRSSLRSIQSRSCMRWAGTLVATTAFSAAQCSGDRWADAMAPRTAVSVTPSAAAYPSASLRRWSSQR